MIKLTNQRTIILLLIIFITLKINSKEPVNYTEANYYAELGYKAFASKKYDEALSHFKIVESYVKKNPKQKKYFDHHYRDFSMIGMIQKRKRLNEISPVTTHKFLVLYIENTDALYMGIKVKETFTEEMKKKARISQDVSTRYMETLSNGLITLSFEEINLKSTLKDFIKFNSMDHGVTKVITVHADIQSLDPYPGEFLLKNYNKYDSFLFYWAGEKLKKGKKGRGTAMGGSMNVPLIPYVTFGTPRGRLIISSNLSHRPGTLFHEIFHTMEQRYSVTPSHGFWKNKRNNFPSWKGEGEFDYYRYHFENTFKKNGYNLFEYIKSQPRRISFEQYSKILKKTKKISIYNRKKGNEYHNLAMKYYPKNNIVAEKYFKKALSHNPYSSSTLLRLCSLNHTKNKKSIAYDYIKRSYGLAPYDPEVCYWMGVQHYHKKRFDDSIRYFTEAITYNPEHENSLQYRGFVYVQTRQYNKAYNDYKKCLSISDKHKKFITLYLSGKAKKGDKKSKELMKRLGLN